MNITLASTSKYRAAQLSRITKNFSTLAPKLNEDTYKEKITDPVELAKTLATLKAKSVKEMCPNDLIIGGDQVLAFNGTIFSKPGSEENAFKQLKSLSGDTHELITATTYIVGEEVIETVITAKMKMRSLSDEEITNYIKRDNPIYCCGSYMLENSGIGLFEEINCSDYTSIIGIPLMTTTTILLKNGIKIF